MDLAKAHGVIYGFSLAPGINPADASQKALDILCKKMAIMQDMGVTFFGLFYDDILAILSTPEDVRVSVEKPSAIRRTRSWNTSKTEAQWRAFSSVPPSMQAPQTQITFTKLPTCSLIRVAWTCPTICSYEIPFADTQRFREMVKHPIGIGDNHPVAGGNCMGTLRNRAPDLYRVCEAFLSNPVSHSEPVSEIAAATMADYGWNPEEYDPDWSLDMSLRRFAIATTRSGDPNDVYSMAQGLGRATSGFLLRVRRALDREEGL